MATGVTFAKMDGFSQLAEPSFAAPPLLKSRPAARPRPDPGIHALRFESAPGTRLRERTWPGWMTGYWGPGNRWEPGWDLGRAF